MVKLVAALWFTALLNMCGTQSDGSSDAGASSDAGTADASSDAGKVVDASADGGPSLTPPPQYRACPTDGKACIILPFGDSIMAEAGPRPEMFHWALQDGHKITFVGSRVAGPDTVDGVPFSRWNEGISGAEIDTLTARIPRPALETIPHVVLLMIGTNDVWKNVDLPNAPARLGVLIDTLTANAPDALIIVTQIVPFPENDAAAIEYNAAIPALVQSRSDAGAHVVLVDMHSGFPQTGLADGIHPNAEGYEFMANVWYEELIKHF